MRRIALIAGVVIALSGCAVSAPAEQPTKPASAKNDRACAEVQEVSSRVPAALVDGTDAASLEDLKMDYDKIVLQSEGEVQERIIDLLETIPEHPIFWLSSPADDYFEALEEVGDACTTEDPNRKFVVHSWG